MTHGPQQDETMTLMDQGITAAGAGVGAAGGFGVVRKDESVRRGN